MFVLLLEIAAIALPGIIGKMREQTNYQNKERRCI
jgi:hypothetical protein